MKFPNLSKKQHISKAPQKMNTGDQPLVEPSLKKCLNHLNICSLYWGVPMLKVPFPIAWDCRDMYPHSSVFFHRAWYFMHSCGSYNAKTCKKKNKLRKLNCEYLVKFWMWTTEMFTQNVFTRVEIYPDCLDCDVWIGVAYLSQKATALCIWTKHVSPLRTFFVLVHLLRCSKIGWEQMVVYTKTTRWAPTTYKWNYNIYKWPNING